MDNRSQAAPDPQGGEPKNKNLAIMLALLTGFFVWAYTYRKDKWKFWIALSVTVIVFIILTAIMVSSIASFEKAFNPSEVFLEEQQSITSKIRLALPLTLVFHGIWIWGVVDAVRRPAKWYRNYPGD